MGLHVFLPDLDLADYVDGIWVQELALSPGEPGSISILPGTSSVICVQYEAPVRVDADSTERRSTVTGLQTQTRHYYAIGAVGSVVVRFTPWGATRVLKGAMTGFTDRHVDLRALFAESRVAQLEEDIRLASTAAVRAGIMQTFLRERLGQGIDQLVRAVAQRIRETHGADPVSVIAREHQISDRQLERRFLAEIGVSPKTFARIVRFQFAMQLQQTGRNWIDTACHAGYFDQAHMIRDFRSLTGNPPGKISLHSPGVLAQSFNFVRTRSGFSNAVFI